MQNKKTEDVNDEQRSGRAKTKKTDTRHANEHATQKPMRRRTKTN